MGGVDGVRCAAGARAEPDRSYARSQASTFAPKAAGGARDRVDLDAPDPETKLVALVRAAAPLRRALARLAARMQALRGWERIGFPRRRDYAAEILGISGRRLQELAHRDGAFAGLPAIERAFASGRLTWTKARLLARVATPEDVERWIALAAAIPACELAREVRSVDARTRDLLQPETDEEGESEAKETVFVHCTPAVRAKWHRARFLASRLEGHPVPAWRVAESLAAEALSAIPYDEAALERMEAEQAMDRAGSSDPGKSMSTGCDRAGAGESLGTERDPGGHEPPPPSASARRRNPQTGARARA